MSTKYYLNKAINPSLASLSSLFATLNHGHLIDQFFSCDWNLQFKLNLAVLLHKWTPQQGCIDLLSVRGIKKVSDDVPNLKNSLLYLMPVAKLDIELFLLRDELSNNPGLPLFQECFFEDYNIVPEYLALALMSDTKHYSLLTDNKSIIDELLITLLVQVFEKSPMIIRELITVSYTHLDVYKRQVCF